MRSSQEMGGVAGCGYLSPLSRKKGPLSTSSLTCRPKKSSTLRRTCSHCLLETWLSLEIFLEHHCRYPSVPFNGYHPEMYCIPENLLRAPVGTRRRDLSCRDDPKHVARIPRSTLWYSPNMLCVPPNTPRSPWKTLWESPNSLCLSKWTGKTAKIYRWGKKNNIFWPNLEDSASGLRARCGYPRAGMWGRVEG